MRTVLIGKQYSNEKNKVGGQKDNNNAIKNEVASRATSFSTVKTEVKVAKEHNIAPRTVRNAEKFSQSITTLKSVVGKDVTDRILKDDIKITKGEVNNIAKMDAENIKKAI